MSETIYTPISKEDAKLQNLSRYYTGNLCKRGHLAERYVSSGHCIRCAHETANESRARNPDAYKAWYHGDINRLRGQMLNYARGRAKKKNLPFSIVKDDIIIPDKCPIFGIPLISSKSGWLEEGSPTLDRIKCADGYVRGNVLVVSWKANKMKNNSSVEDLKTLVEFYSKL